MADEKQPTPEELRQAQEVSTAAGTALAEAASEGEGKEGARTRADAAVQQRAEKVGFKLSEEDRHALVDELIERLDAMGAFQQAPAPAASAAAPAPEAAAQQAAEQEAAQPVPRKRTFAQKYAGED